MTFRRRKTGKAALNEWQLSKAPISSLDVRVWAFSDFLLPCLKAGGRLSGSSFAFAFAFAFAFVAI